MSRDARVFALRHGTGPALAGGLGVAPVAAHVDTDGTLFGYTVEKDGRTICTDPSVWLDLRGQGSFIACD